MIAQPRSYEDLEDNFWELEPRIDEWDSYLTVPYEELPQIPGYVGMGNHSFAIRMQENERDVVLRLGFFADTKSRVKHVNNYSKSLLKGVGIPYVEQVVAAHRLYGFILSNFVEGEDGCELSPSEMSELPNQTVETLASTLFQMYNAGIYPDCIGHNNILYNRQDQTFSFIDCIDETKLPLPQVVSMASLAIGSSWNYRNTSPEVTQSRLAAQRHLRQRILAYL